MKIPEDAVWQPERSAAPSPPALLGPVKTMTMEKNVLVYADLLGTPELAGRLWARVRKNRESASFEYDEGWLAHSNRFSRRASAPAIDVPE